MERLEARGIPKCSTATMALAALFEMPEPPEGCALDTIFPDRQCGIQIAVSRTCPGAERAAWVLALHAWGVKTLVLFGAGVSIASPCQAKDLSLIHVVEDHVNLLGEHPLIGRHDARFGSRFPDMSDAYSRRDTRVASPLPSCIYVSCPAEKYQTERVALQSLGGSFAGPCFAPEALAAHPMGMEVLAFMVPTRADWWEREGPDTGEVQRYRAIATVLDMLQTAGTISRANGYN